MTIIKHGQFKFCMSDQWHRFYQQTELYSGEGWQWCPADINSIKCEWAHHSLSLKPLQQSRETVFLFTPPHDLIQAAVHPTLERCEIPQHIITSIPTHQMLHHGWKASMVLILPSRDPLYASHDSKIGGIFLFTWSRCIAILKSSLSGLKKQKRVLKTMLLNFSEKKKRDLQFKWKVRETWRPDVHLIHLFSLIHQRATPNRISSPN